MLASTSTGAPPLTAVDLGLAALLLLAHAAVSVGLRLGLGKRLLFAAVRATLQLLLVGFVLTWVFDARHPLAVLVVALVMGSLAGVEAARRATRKLPGLRRGSMLVMLVSSFAVTTWGLAVVLRAEPFWDPRYALPILGMVLGNALNGVSLGLGAALDGLVRRRVEVEQRLAFGAPRDVAVRDVVRDAVRTGTVPILNAMIAAGVISLPGMMTGQILAGEDPSAAARYQLFILFAIAGGVALGTVGAVRLAVRLAFDERGRLRLDRFREREA